ncbi:MAG: DUF6531 domain-containing protein [Acidobacteriota bacterium]
MFRKSLSVILVITFLLSMMPLGALALDPAYEFVFILGQFGTLTVNGHTVTTWYQAPNGSNGPAPYYGVTFGFDYPKPGEVYQGGDCQALAVWRQYFPDKDSWCYFMGTIDQDYNVHGWPCGYDLKFPISGIGSLNRNFYYKPDNTLSVGDPIDPSTGAHIINQPLLAVNGVRSLSFSLHYNSLDLGEGSLGRGWSHDFEKNIQLSDTSRVILSWDSNNSQTFTSSDGVNYSCSGRMFVNDTLTKQTDGSFVLKRNDQTSYTFNSSGQLIQQLNLHGQPLDFTYNSQGRLATVTEPVSGKALNLIYNTSGKLETVIDSAYRQVSFGYNSDRCLTGITDANGKTNTFTYNSIGQVLTETDGDQKLVFSDTYDDQGRVQTQDDGRTDNQLLRLNYDETVPGTLVTTFTDRNGQSSVYTFNDKYELQNYRDPNGNTHSYTYDDQGNMATETDPLGNTVGMDYDTKGNLKTLTNPLGKSSTMTYDDRNNLLTITNTMGKSITYGYDDQNHVTSVLDPLGHRSSSEYFNGFLTSTTSPRGGNTVFTYTYGLPETITDPTGRMVTYGYDGAGRVNSITNALGKSIIMDHDPIGNLRSITDPLGHTRSFTYDASNRLLTETDPKGYIYTYHYDANENLDSIINPAGYETKYGYDGEDRLATITDARGNTTSFAYDPKGRLKTTTDAMGNVTGIQYDTADYIKGRTDAFENQILTISYDKAHNPLTLTDVLGNVLTNKYDDLGRLEQQTDPMGYITKYGYDDLNRLVNSTDATGGAASLTYDADGNVDSVKDLNQNTTGAQYDLAGRLLNRTLASGASTTYEYNDIGLLAKVINGRGQITTYQYDDTGRLKIQSDPAGTINYSYDDNGNVLTVGDSVGTTIREYDNLNRVRKYTDAKGNLIQYDYDKVGNLLTLTYPGGKQVTYEYDSCNRLKKVIDWNGRETVYDYDANSRLKTTTRPDGSIETRGYNVAGQIKQIKDVDKNNHVVAQYDFEYDAAGKIISEQKVIPNQPFAVPEKNMTYGADNRLATYNGQNVVYDADGNMTFGPLKGQMGNFTYDCRNRLTVAGSTYYQYDAENHRIAVNENGQQTDYVISPSAMSQALIQTAPDGTKTFYVYGLGLLGQENSDGSYLTNHYDLRGSTVAITNVSGEVVDRFQYSPYGELVYRLGTTSTPFLYNGRDGVMSDSNGLYYMRARPIHPLVLPLP